jgi:Lar family restriction alleviation protein
MTAPELKPCPFCGKMAHIRTEAGSELVGYVTTATVRCGSCGAIKSDIDSRDANGWANASDASAKAITAWNTRADIAAAMVAAEREACAAMIEATAYTSNGDTRSLQPVRPEMVGQDMHHATIAAAIRNRGKS